MALTAVNPAMRRYFRRFGTAMTLYIVLLVPVVSLLRHSPPPAPWLYLLAVLPALPILGVFYALGRYVVEEQDEYLRARMVRQTLYATAMTLAITTVWNFLANFAGVPPLQWVGVLWFACFGVAAAVVALEGR